MEKGYCDAGEGCRSDMIEVSSGPTLYLFPASPFTVGVAGTNYEASSGLFRYTWQQL